MNAVFNSIVKWESNYAMSYGCPLSRSAIMRQNSLNLYQYRKQVKELKEKDLIKYERYIERVYCEGFLQDVYFVQGWLLTDKGRNTELFNLTARNSPTSLNLFVSYLVVESLLKLSKNISKIKDKRNDS